MKFGRWRHENQRLEPLDRAFGRQFGSSEAKLDGQVRPRAAQRAQDGTPDRPRAAQEHRTARQASPPGQAERSKGRSWRPGTRGRPSGRDEPEAPGQNIRIDDISKIYKISYIFRRHIYKEYIATINLRSRYFLR